MPTTLYDPVRAVQVIDSCSLGAGRVLTRTEARREIHPEALARSMRRIVWPEHLARRLVEEAPSAYRDIARVSGVSPARGPCIRGVSRYTACYRRRDAAYLPAIARSRAWPRPCDEGPRRR